MSRSPFHGDSPGPSHTLNKPFSSVRSYFQENIKPILDDLQSSTGLNITTTPTSDGGYCVKFNANKQTSNRSRSPRTGAEETYGSKYRTKGNSLDCFYENVSPILDDLQNSSGLNITTTPTSDGGYCVKFNVNKQTSSTSNRSRSPYAGPEETYGPSTHRIKQITLGPENTVRVIRFKSEEELNLPPSQQSSPYDDGLEYENLPESHQRKTGLDDKVMKEAEETIERMMAYMNKSPYSGKREAGPFDSYQEDDKRSMLVCVLVGPSMELTTISNSVQKMAKDSGVSVRMNAPIHH